MTCGMAWHGVRHGVRLGVGLGVGAHRELHRDGGVQQREVAAGEAHLAPLQRVARDAPSFRDEEQAEQHDGLLEYGDHGPEGRIDEGACRVPGAGGVVEEGEDAWLGLGLGIGLGLGLGLA